MSREGTKASYAVVGVGLAGRGMGWFHALQLVNDDVADAALSDIVEPFFLGEAGKSTGGGEAFDKDVVQVWKPKGVQFHASLTAEACWAAAGQGPKIALIAGRTVDNPKLFRQALAAGATHVLLEKPGAPTVEELEAMAEEAKAKNVPVFMGFIKNIAAYFTEAFEVVQKTDGSRLTLISRNDYTKDTLAECFARNSEGLLKNMAIHELALAAQFFGMRADNVTDVTLEEPDNCECLTLDGRTDFSKIDFTLTNSHNDVVRISADRCAGDGCCAKVTDKTGKEIFSKELVDDASQERVKQRMAQHPDWLSYLITQEPEYADLKARCARAAIDGVFPPAVATIDIAIAALKLAEYLTPVLQAKLQQNK
mmetsp:Transcript_33054/g.105500  ORF Transcript_33054/g.105500 Transcript_33054/m.105500 type:complete len:367 (+) Transcript_33054:111-1211(+)